MSKGIRIKHNLERLLDNSLQSNYWLGFILADGYINKNVRLRIVLSEVDKVLLYNFCSYLGIDDSNINFYKKKIGNIEYKYVSISIMDSMIIPKLTIKYNINAKKTYNPPTINYKASAENIALYIGFIDGDGSIRKLYNRQDYNISIKCHKSWYTFLSELQVNLYIF